MSRRPRITISEVPVHLIQRGNNRQACFYAKEDYQSFLDWLQKYAGASGCAVHAYVLMTNHVHLLVTPTEKSSSGTFMKLLGQRYAQGQPGLSAQWNPLGRGIPQLHCRAGTVPAHLPAIYRAQSCSGRTCCPSRRVSLVQLSCQWARRGIRDIGPALPVYEFRQDTCQKTGSLSFLVLQCIGSGIG